MTACHFTGQINLFLFLGTYRNWGLEAEELFAAQAEGSLVIIPSLSSVSVEGRL